MKTIKEKYAPLFQELGKQRGERRYYEACSVPWFEFEWATADGGTCPPASDARTWRLPFEKMVLVLRAKEGDREVEMPFYLEQGVGDGDFAHSGMGIFPDGGLAGWGVMSGSNMQIEEAKKRLSVSLYGIALFCRACWDPGVHVAAVRPVNRMKRVEWLKSREHYVLLRSNHPANAVTDQRKCVEMNYDEAEVLKRMVHRVRAHARVLRSPRFRHKQGLVIWVQPHWRGPEEWINKRSRQIYRWVDKKTLLKRKEGDGGAA